MFLQLIRALFPRWNFFDRIGYRMVLQYRLKGEDTWHAVRFTQRRAPRNLFLNPTGGMRLAEISLIENFAREAQENPQGIESRSTYRMIHSLLKIYLKTPESFQFKVVAEKDNGTQEIFQSEWVTP